MLWDDPCVLLGKQNKVEPRGRRSLRSGISSWTQGEWTSVRCGFSLRACKRLASRSRMVRFSIGSRTSQGYQWRTFLISVELIKQWKLFFLTHLKLYTINKREARKYNWRISGARYFSQFFFFILSLLCNIFWAVLKKYFLNCWLL